MSDYSSIDLNPIRKFMFCFGYRDNRTLVVHTHAPAAIFEIVCTSPDAIIVSLAKDLGGFNDLSEDEKELLLSKARVWYPTFCKENGLAIVTNPETPNLPLNSNRDLIN